MILLLLPFSSAYGDSGGCPDKEMHQSPNGLYYLKLLPQGACYEPDYKLEWTYGKTGGPIYYQRNGHYPTDVSISNDGERLIIAGNYVHNLLGKVEEGLWIYNKSGALIRHIEPPFTWPEERSASSHWWFGRSCLSSTLGVFVLTTTDGVRRIYLLSNGNLILVLPALWQALCLFTLWVYVSKLLNGGPHFRQNFQTMRQKARVFPKILIYSLLAAILASIFIVIGYYVDSVLIPPFTGDDHTRFNSFIGRFDFDFWLKMTIFEGTIFFIVHMFIGILTSKEMSFKISLITAGSMAIMFLLVITDTSAFFYPILFLPITASAFLLWPENYNPRRR